MTYNHNHNHTHNHTHNHNHNHNHNNNNEHNNNHNSNDHNNKSVLQGPRLRGVQCQSTMRSQPEDTRMPEFSKCDEDESPRLVRTCLKRPVWALAVNSGSDDVEPLPPEAGSLECASPPPGARQAVLRRKFRRAELLPCRPKRHEEKQYDM